MTKDKPKVDTLYSDFKGLAKLWPDLRADKRLVVIGVLLVPVVSAIHMSLPLILKSTVDQGILAQDTSALAMFAGFYLVAVIAEYGVRAAQNLSIALAVNRMIKRLRARLLNHVMRLRCSFHDQNLSGALVTRATSDFDNLNESLNMGVITPIVDVAVLISCLVGMFLLSWKLALVALIILPFVGWIVHAFSRALRHAMLKARKKIAVLNAFTQECLYGNSTIKLLTAEDTAKDRYNRMNVEYRDAQMASVVLDASMFSVLDGMSSITIGIVLWVAVQQVTGDTQWLSAGVIVAFVQYIGQLYEPLKQLGSKIAMLQGAFTAIDRIFGVLEKKDFITGGETVDKIDGHVEFRNVDFSYTEEKPFDTSQELGESGDVSSQVKNRILQNVSFTMQAGATLALVGATGSGKSTIVKLVSRLYDGYTGDIFIDHRNIRQLDPTSLRQHVAIVPQEIALFEGTIAFNIGLGFTEDRERIKRAAAAVGADSFINRLPGGLEFRIGEQGGGLSLGQKQLLVFARALVRDPGLVILDEATSSVDPESEQIIQTATSRILAACSVIVIAHRLSTIRQCDQILVIERGKVVESGTHAELMRAEKNYHSLAMAFS